MKLITIYKSIINEDSWGNNPSSGGSAAPGKTPNATSPAAPAAAQANVKMYDVLKDYQTLESTIEKEEEQAKKTLKTSVAQQVGNKKVQARASKGAVGQVEKDYTIDVVDVDVSYQSEKFYIILKGKDKKDYYINTGFKIKVLGAATNTNPTKETPAEEPPTAPTAPNATGRNLGIKYPQNMGVSTNKPNTVGTP
jgi:hypothetical protein